MDGNISGPGHDKLPPGERLGRGLKGWICFLVLQTLEQASRG